MKHHRFEAAVLFYEVMNLKELKNRIKESEKPSCSTEIYNQ